ncbi:MAG: hypothetical protein ACI9CA_000024 [Natronomonas sp.]|jgi:hypothetical protein
MEATTQNDRQTDESQSDIPDDPPEQPGAYRLSHDQSTSPETRTVAWRQELAVEDHYVRVQKHADGSGHATAYYSGHDTSHTDLTDGQETTPREAYEAALAFIRGTDE